MKVNLKKKLQNVIFLLILLKICVVFSQNQTLKKRIIIDVGHGGKDTGAIGINGIQEKDIVLNIAKEILKLNKTILDKRFDIYLTRYTDTLISLSDRSKIARAIKGSIFISLYCNASQTTFKGIEVFVNDADSPYIKESITLALSILDESTQKLGFIKRAVKYANFQVLRESKAFCAAILLELGFVTNADEADYFSSKKNIKAMALAIVICFPVINFCKIKISNG